MPVAKDHVVSQIPHLLPEDLPEAMRRLPDHELEKLFDTVSSEMRRRQPVPDPAPFSAGASSNRELQKKNRAITAAKTPRKSDPLPVTQAKMNAIRAALKAGIKPNTIARQFGVSLSAIKKALESAKS